LPQAVQPELPAWINELIDRCLRHNPEDRFGSMEEVLSFIENARRTAENGPTSRQNQVLVANQTAEQNAAYSNRDSEDLRQGDRAGDCLLINKIEKGGYSEVWRAKHTIQGRDYAMKVFFPSVQFDNVLVEFDVLNDLSHPNVVKFIYNGRLANGRYYTLMELLEGDNLRKYVFGNPPQRLTYPNVYRAGQELCAALTYLHSKGFIHRDIKPHNIIWNRQERFVLIDFNVAGTEANTDRAGTDAYAPPDKLEGNRRTRWDASCDTFALGVTLYELVCHKHPYRSGIPTLTNAPEHPRSYNSDVSDEFAAFLLKAVQPRTADRFETAADMLTALKDIGIGGLLHPVKPPDPMPVSTEAYVDALNKLFSQSRYNNAGTRASTIRGLDWFARDTYIETRLDTRLKQAILAGTFRLVIITGNAGDGKTAFIQRLEDELRADSRAMMAALPTQNGASFQISGIPFRSNYDGSQDEAGQDNNTVLDEFFRPFVGLTDVSHAKEGRLVGINEGRLVEYLQSRRAELGYLAETVEGFFYNENTTVLPAGMLIINLNVRAMVGSPADTEPSLFRKQVGAFVRPDHWQGCANCAVSEACFIRFNAQSMNDPVAGSEVISRMESLVRTVHFRRDLHITMRDMRSLLAFWITRDHSCADVQQMVAQSPETVTWLSKHYYNLTAPQKDRGNQDRLVEKLRRLDVGRSVVPALDRALFFSPLAARNYLDYGTREGNLLDALNQLQATSGTGLADNERQAAIRRVQQLLARHQYFEGRFAQPYTPDSSKDSKSSKDSTQTEEPLRRYKGEAVRNPYRSVNAFSEMVSLTRIFSGQQAQQATERAMRSIAMAIARLENCHNTDLAAKYIVQAAGRPDPLSASYRLFPLTDFELVEDRRPSLSEYMEYVPDRLIFRHRDPDNRHIALTISLDLYEMLYYIQQGYAPSLNDLKGRFVEYSVFRNMLANLPYRKVVVTGSGYNPGSSIENYVTIEADDQNRLIIHVEELS
jgi:serine/threonine protein kinase